MSPFVSITNVSQVAAAPVEIFSQNGEQKWPRIACSTSGGKCCSTHITLGWSAGTFPYPVGSWGVKSRGRFSLVLLAAHRVTARGPHVPVVHSALSTRRRVAACVSCAICAHPPPPACHATNGCMRVHASVPDRRSVPFPVCHLVLPWGIFRG
jgi:hypothetical protein